MTTPDRPADVTLEDAMADAVETPGAIGMLAAEHHPQTRGWVDDDGAMHNVKVCASSDHDAKAWPCGVARIVHEASAVRDDATRAAEAEVAAWRNLARRHCGYACTDEEHGRLLDNYRPALAAQPAAPHAHEWHYYDGNETEGTEEVCSKCGTVRDDDQPAAPEPEPVVQPCQMGERCPDARRWGAVHKKHAQPAAPCRFTSEYGTCGVHPASWKCAQPAAPEAEPERCAGCGHAGHTGPMPCYVCGCAFTPAPR